MAALVTDPLLEAELIADRQERGIDGFDEVWDGVYVMSPLANDEHQYLVKELTMIIGTVIDWQKLGQTRPGINISDRHDDWTSNYRIPDVAVYLNGTKAENCGAFWYGGPDFAVEIVSDGDKSRDKLDFYADVGTRELLIIDRHPWQLTLFHLDDGTLVSAGEATAENAPVLQCQTIPLSFQLIPNAEPGIIRVSHSDGHQQWDIEIQVD